MSRGLRAEAWAFVAIFVLAFVVRAALLVTWAHGHKNFYCLGSGIEDSVAASLLRSGAFADPYLIPSGPTAHPPPLWPGLLALIYSAFGTTPTAGYARGLVAIGCYSTLFGLLPWFGRRLGLGTRSGVIAGVVGALVPRQGMDEIIGWGVTANAGIALGSRGEPFFGRRGRDRRGSTGQAQVLQDDAGHNALDSDYPLLQGYAGVEPGLPSIRRFYQAFWAAFPGSRLTFEDVFASGDKVACRFVVHGEHRGEFQRIPPTGAQITMPGITILEFRDGKCTRRWSYADSVGLLQQLGALPSR